MEAAVHVEELTSGASGRLIPVFRNLRQSILSYQFLRRFLLLFYSLFLWILLLLPRRHRFSSASSPPSSPKTSSSSIRRRKLIRGRDEEDTLRRRSLAEAVDMVTDDIDVDDMNSRCKWSTSLFFGDRQNALFCRSWFPISGDLKGILIIIHGLNEHSGRYTYFAKQLISCNFGVYAMDWMGHGGSDGLMDMCLLWIMLWRTPAPRSRANICCICIGGNPTGAFLEKIKIENPGVPCFLFGHSTGGAVVLKAASYHHIEDMLEGIILTSPALRVKPAHPIVGAVAPIFSLVAPRFQFKGANKRGLPVSRDPAAILAKYSDPLVYTGPIRVRTGPEILRISSHLMRNFQSITVPFFVLHGTADRVSDPLASQDLYNEATSKLKNIKLYERFLHDLLFELEREKVAQDIIDWMDKRLEDVVLYNSNECYRSCLHDH